MITAQKTLDDLKNQMGNWLDMCEFTIDGGKLILKTNKARLEITHKGSRYYCSNTIGKTKECYSVREVAFVIIDEIC